MGHLNERLQILGIKTAWDLREADAKRLRSKFSVNMERTVLELRGISCLEMNDLHEPRKRIMTSRSFGRPTCTTCRAPFASTPNAAPKSYISFGEKHTAKSLLYY